MRQFKVPDSHAICIADDTLVALDQAPLCYLEVATVGDGQQLQPLLVALHGDRGRILGRRGSETRERCQQGKGEQRLWKRMEES